MTNCNVSWRQVKECARAIVSAMLSESGTEVSDSSIVLFNSMISQSPISLIFSGPRPCCSLIAKRGVSGKPRNFSSDIGYGLVIQFLESSPIDFDQHCIASSKPFGSVRYRTIRLLRDSVLSNQLSIDSD